MEQLEHLENGQGEPPQGGVEAKAGLKPDYYFS